MPSYLNKNVFEELPFGRPQQPEYYIENLPSLMTDVQRNKIILERELVKTKIITLKDIKPIEQLKYASKKKTTKTKFP